MFKEMPFRGGIISGLVLITGTAIVFVFVLALKAHGCNQRALESEADQKWLNITRLSDNPRGNSDLGFEIVETRQPEAVIYCITVTISRLLQTAELHRLAQLVRLIPNAVWIIVEDSEFPTEEVADIIHAYGLGDQTFQLATPTPEEHKPKHWCEGLVQRNYGLLWIRNQLGDDLRNKAIVYFLDEGCTFALSLFWEMEKIERGKIGVWPVGFTSGMVVERPLVHEGQVVAWNTRWHPERKFPIDMAGFAITYDCLLEYPFARFSMDSEPGHAETDFLQQIVYKLDRLQPMAENCSKVLVWHTQTKRPNVEYEPNEPGPVSYLLP